MRPVPVVVVRRHGLGNVLQLLPVLRSLAHLGRQVELITQPAWMKAIAAIAPEIQVSTSGRAGAFDLDALTLTVTTGNRTAEFMEVLGCSVLADLPTTIPAAWLDRWDAIGGSVVFAPEAAFPARQCPPQLAVDIGRVLMERRVVVVGCDPSPAIACWRDLRGVTSLEDLVAIVHLAGQVICMDSGVLHLAALLHKPTVALFGGISPESRTRPDQDVVVLAGDVPCRPCNKKETCGGAYWCLGRIGAANVRAALESLPRRTRAIRLV